MTPTQTRAAVQGFGKVGRDAAIFLAQAGVRVVSVSDQYNAVFSESGLDVDALASHVARTGRLAGFSGGATIDRDSLMTLDVDLLIPAAVEGVINSANASQIQAKLVVEGANGPTTPEADRILADRGVLVVPDILANAGGVLVSYFEWVQANQAYWWREDEVETRLRDRMLRTWHEVFEEARAGGITLREAATLIAVRRVADAHRLRGLYP